MAKLSTDLGAPRPLHPRENLFVSGNLGAINAEIIVASDGANSFSLDTRGVSVLTIEVSGTVDGTNWTPIPVRPINLAAVGYQATIPTPGNNVYVGKCAQYRQVRARVTAYTSGLTVATLAASTAALDDSLQGLITPLLVTTTAAAGAVATLTLPAPGAGLRQYLTYLRIVRFATAVLTPAAAPVIVTTTNLPGTPAFSFPADAAAQGTVFAYQEDFNYPLAAAAQNTAVTVVAPATPSVIWRVTGGYYNAP